MQKTKTMEPIKQIREFNIRNKSLWSALTDKAADLKLFLVGLVILVGSFGLLMGAVTCAIASYVMVFYGVTLVPAMLTGFFTTGALSLLAGFLLVRAGIPK